MLRFIVLFISSPQMWPIEAGSARAEIEPAGFLAHGLQVSQRPEARLRVGHDHARRIAEEGDGVNPSTGS